jgi:hypothetical protein
LSINIKAFFLKTWSWPFGNSQKPSNDEVVLAFAAGDEMAVPGDFGFDAHAANSVIVTASIKAAFFILILQFSFNNRIT